MQGQVFAVGLNGGVIKVYDARGYQAGPFCTWAVCTHLSPPLIDVHI